MSCELLDVEGSFNVRDLGGYRSAGGRTIKSRRFLRAGSLSGLTGRGRKTLLDAGVSCVIDLRSAQEIKAKPSPLENDGGFEWRHIPMLDYIQSSIGGKLADDFPASMEEMYAGLISGSADGFRRVFDIFADPRYPCALFHCTAGKDRTGVTAMLLLALAGVDDKSIAEDYALSAALLNHLPQNMPEGFPAYVLESRPETMRETLCFLRGRYGGAEGYLSHIGVTPEQRARVLDKLFG